MAKRKRKTAGHGAPRMRVIKGISGTRPIKPPAMRIAAPDTPKERKQQFAQNLDHLITMVGLSRKEAAEEIGLSYRLVRRLVSAGVSRIDDRNKESLEKIVGYLALPRLQDLWTPNLVPFLLKSDEGETFVNKFREKLMTYYEKRGRTAAWIDRDQLRELGEALGIEEPTNESAVTAYLDKTRKILSSDKAEQFWRLIDDYHELISLKKSKNG